MSVNLDYTGQVEKPPESLKERILGVLNENRATLGNYLSTTPDENVYIEAGLTSVPVVLVYRTNGELAKRFDNGSGEFGSEGFSYAKHIVPLVEQLLRDEPAP